MKELSAFPLLIFSFVSLGYLSGCGGGKSTPPPIGGTRALGITTSSLPAGTAGAAYSAMVTAGGGTQPYTWTISGLPSGLTFAAGTPSGTISGTPTHTGTFTVAAMVTDSGASPVTVSASFMLTIAPAAAVAITTTSPLPNATLNSAYSATVTATGGLQPYTWSLATGSSLPAGLTLTSATPSATISGTPRATGTFRFTVNVSDSESPGMTASASFLVTVSASTAITCPAPTNLTLCGSYLFALRGFGTSGLGGTGSVVIAGSFIADNSGNIVGGVEDVNSIVTERQANAAITGGSYVMDSSGDGRGVLTLFTSATSSTTFRFALESAANVGFAAIEEFDASGIFASGIMSPAITPPFPQIAPGTIFALPLEGVNGLRQLSGLLGDFQVGSSGCNGASGSFNSVAGENVVTNTAGTVNTGLTFTGSCTALDPKTGRGTIAITVSGGTPFANSTLNFIYYGFPSSGVIGGLVLGEADPSALNQPILNGFANVVTTRAGGFNASSVVCPCTFARHGTTNGSTATGRGAEALGRVVTTPSGTGANGTVTGTLDENFGGTITLSGVWPYSSYTVDANGVGTFTGAAGTPAIHFVIHGDTFETLDESVSVQTGEIRTQNATTITDPGLPHIIGLGLAGLGLTPDTPNVVGVVTPTGASSGTILGVVDVNGLGGLFAGAATTGSYTIDSITGRGTGIANLTAGSIPIVIYVRRGRQFAVLDVQPGDTDPTLIGARPQ